MGIQRIESFISKLEIARKETAIHAVCLQELEFLRKAYNVNDKPDNKGIFNGLATYKRAITDYRKSLYLTDKKHTALEFLRLSDMDMRNFQKQNNSASFRGFTDLDVWTKSVITDVDGFIETSVSLLTAYSYVDNILGLAALTGRRISEIGFYSEFESVDKDEIADVYSEYTLDCDDFLRVIGLAKKSTYRMEEVKPTSAIIPVLYDSATIDKTHKGLRKEKVFNSADHFHDCANKDISRKVKMRYSQFLGVGCKAHDLRKAYARIVFDYYSKLPSEALPILISKILVQSIPANYIKYSAS